MFPIRFDTVCDRHLSLHLIGNLAGTISVHFETDLIFIIFTDRLLPFVVLRLFLGSLAKKRKILYVRLKLGNPSLAVT